MTGLVVLALLALRSPAGADQGLRLRQEYNEVVATIDTMVRQGDARQLEALAQERPTQGLVPDGFEAVLVYWADDEAEVFVNGYRIGQTRLTPAEVVIPSLYLGVNNQLRAHCWDTDRVESGFMAGLYLRGLDGRLRRVLVTGAKEWQADGAPAQERYYTHAQPDIPGAQVIWGRALFGEVWLEAAFGAGALQQAVGAAPAASVPGAREQTMDLHQVISRLVRLQARRQELAEELRSRSQGALLVPYRGSVSNRLAFTLGRAGPLSEAQSTVTSRQLHRWARSLPPVQRELVFRPPRPLKGTAAATPERAVAPTSAGQEDRRADYQPPPERGPAAEGAAGRSGVVLLRPPMVSQQGVPWRQVAAAAGLAVYVSLAAHGWWRLCQREVWRR